MKLIFLDLRFHRSSYAQPDSGDFLGPEQWSWLNRTLRESHAGVHIIASSIQVLRPFPGVGEVWGRFPNQRTKLLQLIKDTGAKGVVFLSGDVHFAQVNKCGGLTEITSSGLTHSMSDIVMSFWMVHQTLVIFEAANFFEI